MTAPRAAAQNCEGPGLFRPLHAAGDAAARLPYHCKSKAPRYVRVKRKIRGERSNEIGAPAKRDWLLHRATPDAPEPGSQTGTWRETLSSRNPFHSTPLPKCQCKLFTSKLAGWPGGRRQKNVRRPPQRHQLKCFFSRSSRGDEAQISLEAIIYLEPSYVGCYPCPNCQSSLS